MELVVFRLFADMYYDTVLPGNMLSQTVSSCDNGSANVRSGAVLSGIMLSGTVFSGASIKGMYGQGMYCHMTYD